MSTTFVTSKIFDQLVAVLLKNSGALTLQIGGLSSNTDWGTLYPTLGQGNNLNIVADTSTTVVVKAGGIWNGSAVIPLASDTTIGAGHAVTLTTGWPNYVYAVNSGGNIVIQVVSSTLSPTPPGGTIKLIGVVYVGADGKVFQIVTIPSMVNQIASITPTISLVGWDALTPANAAIGGRFNAANPTNALQITGQFNLIGANNIGEFALTTGASGMVNTEVPGQSNIIAYLAQSAQISASDALLTLTWNIAVNEPSAFY